LIRTAHSDLCTRIFAIIFSLMLHAGIIFLIKPGTPYIGSKSGKELQVRLVLGGNVKQEKLAEISAHPEVPFGITQEQPANRNSFQNTQPTETPISIPEDHYYKINELDISPRPISLVNPAYPESVPPNIKHGSVKLLLKLDENGIVTDSIALTGEPEGFFENTARDAFIGARFTPGIKDGINVKTQLTLTIHFHSPMLGNPQ